MKKIWIYAFTVLLSVLPAAAIQIPVAEFHEPADYIALETTSLEDKIETTKVITKEHRVIERKKDDTHGNYLEFMLLDFINDGKKSYDPNEDNLFEKIMKTKIERTDIIQHLFKDELTLDFDRGPVDRIRFYGAYMGGLTNSWEAGSHNANYDIGFIDVGVVGHFIDDYTDFKLQANLKAQGDKTFFQNFITDAYISNRKIPHHRIVVGNSRNQIGYEGGLGTYLLPFAARSQISRNFSSTRALGARVVGTYPYAEYSLAANSSDRFWREFFPGAEFTGWLNLKPFGKMEEQYGKLVIGGGINTGRNKTDYTVGGAYVGYTYKKFMANFECAIADGYNGSYVSEKKAGGFYTTIGYKITSKLQLVGRYDKFDPDRDITNNDRQEISTGINYFIKGQAIKLILNYVFCDNENAPDSNRIIFATQFLI